MKNLMSRAAMDHFQVAIMPADDAARERVAAAIADLSQTYTGDRRWRVEPQEPATTLPEPLGNIIAAVRERPDASVLALAQATSQPARSAFAETRFGRLAAGQRADFVVLSADPLRADGEAPHVLATWIGGRPVWQAR